ncbi:hypothetical protein Trydic_g8507 [Trypoxylus dichotomus]
MPDIVEGRDFTNGVIVDHFDLTLSNRDNRNMPPQKAYTGDKVPILHTKSENLQQVINKHKLEERNGAEHINRSSTRDG